MLSTVEVLVVLGLVVSVSECFSGAGTTLNPPQSTTAPYWAFSGGGYSGSVCVCYNVKCMHLSVYC